MHMYFIKDRVGVEVRDPGMEGNSMGMIAFALLDMKQVKSVLKEKYPHLPLYSNHIVVYVKQDYKTKEVYLGFKKDTPAAYEMYVRDNLWQPIIDYVLSLCEEEAVCV